MAHSPHAQTHLGMLVIVSSHSLGHSNVLTHSATATSSLAWPQQCSHSLGHSNVLTCSTTAMFSHCSATATSSLARPQQCSHSLGHSNVLTRLATAMFSLAQLQQRSHSLSHSNTLTHSATATFSLAQPQQRSHSLSHSNVLTRSASLLLGTSIITHGLSTGHPHTFGPGYVVIYPFSLAHLSQQFLEQSASLPVAVAQ